jgi:CelD/BcsL family acetyltransferase involved in cellulose biosynthesis
MVRIAHLRNQLEVRRLVPEWQSLWQRIAAATPFQSPEWLLPWWEGFGNSQPVIVTAHNGDELIAVLPLYFLEEAGRRKLLPIGISLSDYLDALIDPAQQSLVSQLLASLIDIPDWDELYLPDLEPSAELLTADCPLGLLEERGEGEPCPVLSLPNSVECLREAVPRKTLRDLRQARRHASGTGELSVARPNASTLDEVMHEFFRLHENRWQRVAGHGVCSDPTVREFHLRAAKRMLGAGMLRLYLFRLGKTPLAAYYGFTAKGAAYAYLSGFDPDYAELSPGTQIVGYAIEEAIREGVREFHFLRGGESYKYAWGAVDRRNTWRCLRRRC